MNKYDEQESYATQLVDMHEKKINLSESLENWMSLLPPKLRGFPIIHLAIPGN